MSQVRFIHTADWQIGKPFAGISDDHNRVLAQQERVVVLGRIAAAARERGAELVLVAGDVFDSPTPTRAMVSAACAAIGGMGVPVFVIPGNHDHGGVGGIWEQAFFKQEQAGLAPNLRVLRTAEPVELDNLVLFPCPLGRRAESSDTTAWLRDAGVFALAGAKPRVVLAHGSVQAFGSGSDDDELPGASNHIDLSRLDSAAMDYIALGDWHGTKAITPSAWYSGTPEVDRFPKGPDNAPGNILSVCVQRGQPPQVEVVRTARFHWHSLERHLADDNAVTSLHAEIEGLIGPRTQEDFLRLDLSGSLGIAATTELEGVLSTLEARLLRLKLDNRTTLAPTEEEVRALTERLDDPLVATVARRLVQMVAEENETARVALRELHARCRAHEEASGGM